MRNQKKKQKKFFFLIKTFKISTTFIAEAIRRLSESLILPFNCKRYANVLKEEYFIFEKEYQEFFDKIGVKLDKLKSSIQSFGLEAEKFHTRLYSIDLTK